MILLFMYHQEKLHYLTVLIFKEINMMYLYWISLFVIVAFDIMALNMITSMFRNFYDRLEALLWLLLLNGCFIALINALLMYIGNTGVKL